MTDPAIWRFIQEHLRREVPVALLVVAADKGSSPGDAGFKMAVGGDGALCGTIGGGKMEHDTVQAARALLGRPDRAPTLRRGVHRAGAAETSGMICGGEQVVLCLPCTHDILPALEAMIDQAGHERRGVLRLSPRGWTFDPHPRRQGARFEQTGDDWLYEEGTGAADTVYIVGGGHVSLALSRVLATLDVRLVVFDDRPHLSTLQDNVAAHEKIVVPFDQVGPRIPEGDSTYVVIATPSHRADESVLRQLAPRRLAYLGLLGSASKVRQVMSRLRADGFADEVLQRVHAPIGLPVHSHTAAEIAISIAAQIIAVRNAPRPAPPAG